MSTQPTERIDLAIIEALDYEHEPPCEHSQHRTTESHFGPAAVLVEAVECPECHDPAVILYLCEKFWNAASVMGITCAVCLTRLDEPYRLIAWVKS